MERKSSVEDEKEDKNASIFTKKQLWGKITRMCIEYIWQIALLIIFFFLILFTYKFWYLNVILKFIRPTIEYAKVTQTII